MGKISFLSRKLSDRMLPDGVNDGENIYNNSTWKIDVLKQNPFLHKEQDSVFQIYGILEKDIIGSETHFPLVLQLDGKEYTSLSGHGLSVSSKCRGLGLGTKLTDRRLDYSDTQSLLLCDASQMHLPILKKLGAIIFQMPRMIKLRHSFSVIENKTNKYVAKLAAPLVDVFLKLPDLILANRVKKLKTKVVVKELDGANEFFEQIVEQDNHRFKEKHSKEWFDWVLKYSLVKDSSIEKKLFGVFEKNRLIGFFMTKKRFFSQASHRGYRNVMMGAVMEWGTLSEEFISDNDLCLLALTSFDDTIDAIELCCPEKESVKFFKKFGMVHLGDGNVVVRFREKSELAGIDGLDNQSNWRLRPAMGDNSLS